MSESRCFCHLTDTKGRRYEVKDAKARQALAMDANGNTGLLDDILRRIATLEANTKFELEYEGTAEPLGLDELTARYDITLNIDPQKGLFKRICMHGSGTYDMIDFSTKQFGTTG